jgi:hypothetical protein
VAEALLADGVYRNQFETGLSSGSVSAFAGGARDTWESSLFGGAYHTEGVGSSERPKYGALELVRHPDGPIPRFGSCYLVLRQSVSTRTSFTFMGSEDARATERLGIMGHMHGVMGALLTEIEQGAMATPSWPPFRTPTLGISHLSVARFLNVLNDLREQRRHPADGEAESRAVCHADRFGPVVDFGNCCDAHILRRAARHDPRCQPLASSNNRP